MNHFTLPRRAAGMALFALGALVLLAGCSKRITSVDAGNTTLQGHRDANSQLLAWFSAPDTVLVYQDNGTIGPDQNPDSPEDVRLPNELNFSSGPRVVHTLLFDQTAASGFQYYRRANNGGLQGLTDYTIQPTLKWLSSGWELYMLDDDTPSSWSPATYTARGLLDGKVTSLSPVTNDALAGVSVPKPSITVTYAVDAVNRDSSVTWTTVPAAAGYWLDVYQFSSSANTNERVASGTPNPVLGGHVKHAIVARFPNDGAATHSYTFGDSTGGEFMTRTRLVPDQEYLVRVTAVDANGSVLAWTRSRGTTEFRHFEDDYQFVQLVGFYKYFPLGAIRIPLPRHTD